MYLALFYSFQEGARISMRFSVSNLADIPRHLQCRYIQQHRLLITNHINLLAHQVSHSELKCANLFVHLRIDHTFLPGVIWHTVLVRVLWATYLFACYQSVVFKDTRKPARERFDSVPNYPLRQQFSCHLLSPPQASRMKAAMGVPSYQFVNKPAARSSSSSFLYISLNACSLFSSAFPLT